MSKLEKNNEKEIVNVATEIYKQLEINPNINISISEINEQYIKQNANISSISNTN